MRNPNIFITLILTVIVAWATVHFTQSSNVATVAHKESAFDRVMRKKTLTCGWINYEPMSYKDPNTGEMRGIFVDTMNNVGKQLDIKINWSETTLANFVEDIRREKYDMFCSAAWLVSPGELVSGEFTSPLYYSQIGAWTHDGNTKFDNNLMSINDPSVTVTGIDGSYASILAVQKFPKAKNLSAPSSAEYITGLLNVAYGKADVTFLENRAAMEFAKKNPGKVRQVVSPVSLDVRPDVMMVKKGEFELQSTINAALLNVQLTGAMDDILNKYELYPGAYKRVKY